MPRTINKPKLAIKKKIRLIDISYPIFNDFKAENLLLFNRKMKHNFSPQNIHCKFEAERITSQQIPTGRMEI